MPPGRLKTIVYLHGFLSTPASPKVQVFAQAAERRGITCRAPNLNVTSPEALKARLTEATADLADGEWALAGSSLGGFYAAHLASQRLVPAVLLNPAVTPWKIGEQYLNSPVTARNGTVITVTREWLDYLKSMTPLSPLAPEKTLLLVTTGDEVLDCRESMAAFPGLPRWVVNGSDHAVSDIARYIDALFSFLTRGELPAGCESGR